MHNNNSTTRHLKHVQKYQRIDAYLRQPIDHLQSPINRQHEKLAKAHTAFLIHQSRSDTRQAYLLAKDLCKTAKKYRMPKFVVEPSSFLYRYYSQYQFNRTKALRAKALTEWASKAHKAEIDVKSLMSDIILANRSKHSKKNIEIKIEHTWQKLRPQLHQNETFDYRKEAYIIGINYYGQSLQWEEMESLCLDAIQFFENYPLKSQPTIALYYRYLINALLALGKNDIIEEKLIDYKLVAQKNDSHLINYQYTLGRIRAAQGRYEEVHTLISAAQKSKAYKYISGVNKLAWEILDGYTSYMTKRKLNKKGKQELSEALAIAKEEDMISDRYSIQLLIIRLLIYTYNEEWLSVETNTSAISKYLSRALIRSGESRSYNFIHMLLHLTKQRYHPVAVKRHSSKYFTKLTNELPHALGSQESYEIIPYEDLWAMIMENLKR